MALLSIWITGLTRSGKSMRLIEKFDRWIQTEPNNCQKQLGDRSERLGSQSLVLAANDRNRRHLADRLSIAIGGNYPVICKTPLGFMTDEVTLFLPLLWEQLNLKAQFPLQLRPETEQSLATRLWRSHLEANRFKLTNISEYRFVRRILDLLQLAGASGIAVEDIPYILEQGLPELSGLGIGDPQTISALLLEWRQWCLERGFLTYGIIYELYWRYLLPNLTYQSHLLNRYCAVFADDLDDYPAIARDLFEFLLDRHILGVFTYNPDGQVRLGLNADPHYLEGLASRCQIEDLSTQNGLAIDLGNAIARSLDDPLSLSSLPDRVRSIQTNSRAELLRKTCDVIIDAVKQEEIKPQEIAIIAPGIDEIARYTLMEILSATGIAIEPLNEQRPLISSPLVRALLTLLGLAYPGLGRLLTRDSVAEMLTILSQKPQDRETSNGEFLTVKPRRLVAEIDPVRAGLIADRCYHVDPEHPHLLPVETFPRWDRLGYQATRFYQAMLAWLETAKSLHKEDGFTEPIVFLDRAIKHFVGNGSYLSYDTLSALRELMETARHFWEVDRRVQQHDPLFVTPSETVGDFIQLLRRGTITANPYPSSSLIEKEGAITLANIFQYRSQRSFHRWQFWLDASSHLWHQGGAATLFAAPLFLREWSGRTRTAEDDLAEDGARLQRILSDLLGRTGDRVYLCHSDLGINGTEQLGPLLPLVHASLSL